MGRRASFVAIGLVVLLAGCATKEAPVATRPAPEAPAAAQPPQGEVYSKLMGRSVKPIAVRPITVKADCSYKDPTGYGGQLRIAVDKSQVQALKADIQVPQHGSCSFDAKDFHQTAREPSVTLNSRSACTIRIWEQEGKVTVAFNSCQDRCQGDSFDYVWPILVNAKTGQCS